MAIRSLTMIALPQTPTEVTRASALSPTKELAPSHATLGNLKSLTTSTVRKIQLVRSAQPHPSIKTVLINLEHARVRRRGDNGHLHQTNLSKLKALLPRLWTWSLQTLSSIDLSHRSSTSVVTTETSAAQSPRIKMATKRWIKCPIVRLYQAGNNRSITLTRCSLQLQMFPSLARAKAQTNTQHTWCIGHECPPSPITSSCRLISTGSTWKLERSLANEPLWSIKQPSPVRVSMFRSTCHRSALIRVACQPWRLTLETSSTRLRTIRLTQSSCNNLRYSGWSLMASAGSVYRQIWSLVGWPRPMREHISTLLWVKDCIHFRHRGSRILSLKMKMPTKMKRTVCGVWLSHTHRHCCQRHAVSTSRSRLKTQFCRVEMRAHVSLIYSVTDRTPIWHQASGRHSMRGQTSTGESWHSMKTWVSWLYQWQAKRFNRNCRRLTVTSIHHRVPLFWMPYQVWKAVSTRIEATLGSRNEFSIRKIFLRQEQFHSKCPKTSFTKTIPICLTSMKLKLQRKRAARNSLYSQVELSYWTAHWLRQISDLKTWVSDDQGSLRALTAHWQQRTKQSYPRT